MKKMKKQDMYDKKLKTTNGQIVIVIPLEKNGKK